MLCLGGLSIEGMGQMVRREVGGKRVGGGWQKLPNGKSIDWVTLCSGFCLKVGEGKFNKDTSIKIELGGHMGLRHDIRAQQELA